MVEVQCKDVYSSKYYNKKEEWIVMENQITEVVVEKGLASKENGILVLAGIGVFTCGYGIGKGVVKVYKWGRRKLADRKAENCVVA